MSSSDKGLDIAGLGKLAEAIPDEAWNKLVGSATDLIVQFASPLTATSTGLGRWIQAKFDGMVEAEKVLAAEVVDRAKEKIQDRRRQKGEGGNARPSASPADPAFVVGAITSAGHVTNPELREMWANLLATEIVEGGVHPECVRILERLSARDARFLMMIHESESGMLERTPAEYYFEAEHSASMSLVSYDDIDGTTPYRNLVLTAIGAEFLNAVTD